MDMGSVVVDNLTGGVRLLTPSARVLCLTHR